jgi:hypothetical protein
MGQGRRIRSWIRCFLLIAGAIQGITPDARDLSSPFAIRVILPSQAGPDDFRDEDDPRDDVCLTDEQSSPLQSWQPHAAHRSATFAGIGLPLFDSTSMMAPVIGPLAEIIPGLTVFEALCRLRC